MLQEIQGPWHSGTKGNLEGTLEPKEPWNPGTSGSLTYDKSIKYIYFQLPIIIGVCLNCGYDVNFTFLSLSLALAGYINLSSSKFPIFFTN